MGEYAMVGTDRVKIGTCESMYYLRFGQRGLVRPLPGNVDVNGPDAHSIRFRFPWPDEDHVAPGDFDPYERAVTIHGLSTPTDIEHYSVQFSAREGYLLSLPCPEGQAGCTPGLETRVNGLKVARNGFAGAVQLVQQKYLRDGRLVPVLRCGGCGGKWRVEDPEDINAVVVACRAEADRRLGGVNDRDEGREQWWHAIADRILEGANGGRPRR